MHPVELQMLEVLAGTSTGIANSRKLKVEKDVEDAGVTTLGAGY